MRTRTIVLLVAIGMPGPAAGQTDIRGPAVAARPISIRVPLILKFVLDESRSRVEGRPVYIIRTNGPAHLRRSVEERPGTDPEARIEVVTLAPP